MKKLFSLTCLVFTMFLFNEVNAQKIGKKIKKTTERKVDQKTTEGIDKGIDKVFEGVGSIFKKKKHADDNDENTKETEDSATVADDQRNDTLPVDTVGFGVYTKFTFEPGNKIIFYDDFEKDKLGDFPVRWETNGSGEVVTNSLYKGNWFSVSGRAGYVPLLVDELPENYTIEFDIATNGLAKNNSATAVSLYFLNKKSYTSGGAGGHAHFHIGMSSSATMAIANSGAEKTPRIQSNLNRKFKVDMLVHFSIAVNKKRLRIWMEEDKIADIPSLLVGNMGRYLLFEVYGVNPEKGHTVLLSNFKIAEAGEDMRSRLLESGRFSTTGIYFNTNEAVIKQESYGVIKTLADYLKENPEVKIEVIGHTDAQGEEEYNRQLSERRAQAVAKALVKEFEIEEGRLMPSGKGESEPVDDNATEKGRANNRRVEFVKI